MTIADMRAKIARLGLKQKDIAEEIGVNEVALSRLLHEKQVAEAVRAKLTEYLKAQTA